MAALGGGRSTLANQGILRVIEATPPGYYRVRNTKDNRNSRQHIEIQLRVAPRVNYTIPLHLLHR